MEYTRFLIIVLFAFNASAMAEPIPFAEPYPKALGQSFSMKRIQVVDLYGFLIGKIAT